MEEYTWNELRRTYNPAILSALTHPTREKYDTGDRPGRSDGLKTYMEEDYIIALTDFHDSFNRLNGYERTILRQYVYEGVNPLIMCERFRMTEKALSNKVVAILRKMARWLNGSDRPFERYGDDIAYLLEKLF